MRKWLPDTEYHELASIPTLQCLPAGKRDRPTTIFKWCLNSFCPSLEAIWVRSHIDYINSNSLKCLKTDHSWDQPWNDYYYSELSWERKADCGYAKVASNTFLYSYFLSASTEGPTDGAPDALPARILSQYPERNTGNWLIESPLSLRHTGQIPCPYHSQEAAREVIPLPVW